MGGGSRSNNTNFVVTRGTSVPPTSLQWEAHAATTPTSSSREERQFHLRVSSGRLTQQQHQLRRHERNVSSTSESPVGGSRSNNTKTPEERFTSDLLVLLLFNNIIRVSSGR